MERDNRAAVVPQSITAALVDAVRQVGIMCLDAPSWIQSGGGGGHKV